MGRLEKFLLLEDAHTDFLETSACMGINPSKEFIDTCGEWLNASYKGTLTDFMELIKKEFSKPFDWNSGGVSQILSLDISSEIPNKKTLDTLSDMSSLACGMNQYVRDVVKISNPYFIHGQIQKYYSVEKKVMGEIKGSKANTADCIITSCPPDKLFSLMSNNKPQSDSNLQFVVVGDEKYYQVSLKKSRSEAQLGKISSFISANLGIKLKVKDVAKGLTNEGVMWDRMSNIMSSVWDKVKSSIKSVMSSVLGRFKKLLTRGVTRSDLKDMASVVGYSGVITESMVRDFNISMINEVKTDIYDEQGRMYSTDGNKVLDKSTQKLVEGIINNPNAAINLINKQLSDLERVIGNNDGEVVGNIQRINSITGDIDPSKIPSLAFYLVANYSSLVTIKEMIDGVDDVAPTIRRLITEMFFGGTKLPLWKVYGASKKGDKSYDYLGTIETFQEGLEGPTTEILGIGVHPSEDKMYYSLKITMLEGIDETKKHFIIVRMGTNSGSGFTSNIEGSNIQHIPLDKKLIDIL